MPAKSLPPQGNVKKAAKPAARTVKYLGLPQQFSNPETILKEIRNLATRGEFIMGKAVTEFETKFARYTGARHAIAVANGTDALFLLLKAAGVEQGDEVITAPNSFIATAGAIVQLGAIPVFADVGPDYNIAPSKIEKAITAKTRAILPVHLTGNPADMPSILKIAKKHNLVVIEDAAQAIGAKINGIHVGNFGLGAGFSLHPLKNLNIWGDGGMITTNNDEIASKIKLLRNHGLKNRDEAQMFGYNSRLDTVQAAVALQVMSDVEKTTQARLDHAKFYDKALAGIRGVTLPPRPASSVRQVFHTYIIQAENRQGLIEHLAKKGIETKIHYPIPIHLHEAAKHLGYKAGDFPAAEEQSGKILTLPIHQFLKKEDLEYVAASIREFYA